MIGGIRLSPWKHVGPQNMINAINVLASMDNNTNMGDAAVMKPYVVACEVFYVHLCEAARLYVVESLVCRTLVPHLIAQGFENQTYIQEEENLLTCEDD
ncbi:hypothetical protein LIER_17390 [Lithospermum erythrorhizon]|uniref:Uncharacterized protein n=1 Tax=Lithospermum erythrorhizon TaxID=34254 RepID=A0AAV3QB00_LITER